MLLGIPLGWLFWRRRKTYGPSDALGLFALLAWEALGRDGWPRLTLLAGAALALTFPATLDSMSAVSAESLRYCVTYLARALPLTGWIAMALLAPQRLERFIT